MISGLKFHHVGIVTKDLANAVTFYEKLGYTASPRYDDPIQKVSIHLMERSDGPMVEIILPAEDNASLKRLLERSGAGPYHTCYEVADLPASVGLLKAEAFWPVGEMVPAVAFGGRRIIFLLSAKIGLIELVEAS